LSIGAVHKEVRRCAVMEKLGPAAIPPIYLCRHCAATTGNVFPHRFVLTPAVGSTDLFGVLGTGVRSIARRGIGRRCGIWQPVC
jgi:hypothetical protein